MEIIKGFKKTEVGIIPKDWEIKSIGQLGSFSKGIGIRKDEAQSGSIPCVRYGEIYTLHNDYIKFYGSFISEEVARRSKKLKKGDILFAGSGETKEEIGKSVAFIDDIEAYVGSDVVILSPKYGESLFYGYLFNLPLVARQKANKGQGDAIVHISASSLSDVLVPVPPIPEQKAIATTLSDIDCLISSLTKLIEKKKNIKQGAMQELLTGRKRLEGFSGDWEEKLLADILEIGHGKLQHNIVDMNGKYPILGTGGEIGRTNSYLYDEPSVLIGRKGTIDEPKYMDTPFWTIDTLFYTRIHNDINPKYLYYMFCVIDWHQYNEASGVPSLSAKTIGSIEVVKPLLDEQTAIADILSEMDIDIDVLEKKINKYKNIKQGMMQELLTGRIRLL